ncbi:MAG: hypothetical protein IT235_01855 [Bacteroidia bacterium]|nr:hypothetical protein [Bacteroidia bacterium]
MNRKLTPRAICLVRTVYLLLSFFSTSSYAQNYRQGTVSIIYDTLPNTALREIMGPIQNDRDSIFIGFDSGFENDSLVIMIGNKTVASGLMNSTLPLGKAGGFHIAKQKQMLLTLLIKNKQRKFEINFNKKFCVAHLHLNLAADRLEWVYTNQVYSAK